MQANQVYTLLNTVTQEILGETVVVNEDLTNVVDVGTAILDNASMDAYVKTLVNHIGKVIFVDRKYSGSAPSVLMDSWEFGSILEKVQADLPQAQENDSWQLADGQEYKQDVFYQPKVSAKFFNSMVTFEVPMSFTERQVKQSFSSATQLNAFMSMLYNSVDKAMTIKIDSLIMRTINNMTAEVMYNALDMATSTDLSTKSSVRAVNLLKKFNDTFFPSTGETPNPNALTVDGALTNPEFVRFVTMEMGKYMDRMGKMSKLFNQTGKERFTPKDKLHIVMLTDLYESSKAYLLSDTFNKEYVELPQAETVPFWQGSGEDYNFTASSSIDVKTSSGNTVKTSGILGVMFDNDALGVTNLDRRVTTHYNAKAEFFNNYYKFDAGYFNDLDENYVVFFIA